MYGVMPRAANSNFSQAQEDEEEVPHAKRPKIGGRTRQPFSQLAPGTQKNKLTQVRNALEEVAAGEEHEVSQVLLALSQTQFGRQHFAEAAASTASNACSSSSNPLAKLVENNEERMLEKCYAQVGRNAIRFRGLLADLLRQ